MENLAPKLIRQRLVMEGTTKKIVQPEQIKDYLNKLAKISDMGVLEPPVSYTVHDMGFAGWIIGNHLEQILEL